MLVIIAILILIVAHMRGDIVSLCPIGVSLVFHSVLARCMHVYAGVNDKPTIGETMENVKRLCAQCRLCRSESWGDECISEAYADYAVRGSIIGRKNGGCVPYRGNLCASHIVMMEEDGATFKMKRPLSGSAWREECRSIWHEMKGLPANCIERAKLHEKLCRAQDCAGLNL